MSDRFVEKTEKYKNFTPREKEILTSVWELTRNNFQPVSYEEIADHLKLNLVSVRKIVSGLVKKREDLLVFFHDSGGRIGRSRILLRLSERIIGKPENALIALDLHMEIDQVKISEFVKNTHEKYGLEISDIELRIQLLKANGYINEPEKGKIVPAPKIWEQKEYLEFVAKNYKK